MLTHRERFHRVFNFEPVDRIPLYYFGTWRETKQRWINEGYTGSFTPTDEPFPQLPGMDPDWEGDLWSVQHLVFMEVIGDQQPQVLEENDDYLIRKDATGKVKKILKGRTGIPHTLKYPLEPTRESWNRFRRYLDPNLPGALSCWRTSLQSLRITS